MHHTKISNVSSEPAQTTSPLLSTLKHENWTAWGEVNVRKFLYLERHRRKKNQKSIKMYWMCMKRVKYWRINMSKYQYKQINPTVASRIINKQHAMQKRWYLTRTSWIFFWNSSVMDVWYNSEIVVCTSWFANSPQCAKSSNTECAVLLHQQTAQM